MTSTIDTRGRAVRSLRVVSHEATRTGAPRVLLDLLRLVRDDIGFPLEVRLDVGGPLAAELTALDTSAGAGPPGALLCNSALAADAVLSTPGVPATIYVHEDRDALDVLLPPTRAALTTGYGRVLCVSEQARSDLEAFGVPAARIEVLPPIVMPPRPVGPDEVARARQALGAPAGTTVVLGCGEAGWRKGADLFVALAGALSGFEDLVFAWLGQRAKPFDRCLDHDIERSGLQGRVRWLVEVTNPHAYFAAADLLAVTSRSDPQPLVPIEAALVGTPSVGFAIGGMADLGADGAAAVVPYPDVAGLADLVAELVRDDTRRKELVASTCDRWARRQSPEVLRPAFLRIVHELVAHDGEVRVP